MKRVQFGIYKIVVKNERLEDVTYTVDARRAIADIKKVNCGYEFDCKASEDFASTVEVGSK